MQYSEKKQGSTPGKGPEKSVVLQTLGETLFQELVETEANYVDVLNMLRKHFLVPLSSLARMKEKDKAVVFAHIRHLADMHTEFFHDLLDSVKRMPSAGGNR